MSQHHRPASIGDASQLFGEPADDFFKPDQTQNSDSNSKDHPFGIAWPQNNNHLNNPYNNTSSHQQQEPEPITNINNQFNEFNHLGSFNNSNNLNNSTNPNSLNNPNNLDNLNNLNNLNNFNPYAPHPQLVPDFIPRSLSANPLHYNDHHPYQRPKLIQSQTAQLPTGSALNRPKVYDAYDPPAIRKKKPTLTTTASLPASPALGGYGFPTQQAQFFPQNNSNPNPNPIPIPPPPPISSKQRSTSIPASNHEPFQLNDFYQHQHQHQHQPTQFIPSVYPSHSYLPNPPSDYGTPQNTPPPPRQPDIHQSSPSPYFQSQDPYAPDPSPQPDHPLSHSPGNSLSTSLNPLDFYRSHDPVESSTAVHKPKLKASSPLKTAVLADEDLTILAPLPQQQPQQQHQQQYHQQQPQYQQHPQYQQQEQPYHYQQQEQPYQQQQQPEQPYQQQHLQQQQQQNHYQEEEDKNQFSREQSIDPIDALNSATQNLSLNTTPSFKDPRLSPPLTATPSSLPRSTRTPENLIQIPDVHVQPASPQITLIEPVLEHAPPATQFDVLADLGSFSTDQPITPSTISNQTSDQHFDYGAPSDQSSMPYGSSSYDNLHESSVDYNPYDAPLHNPDSISNLHSYSSDQSVDFIQNSDPQLSFGLGLSSDYDMVADKSPYQTSTDDYPQPENFTSDSAMGYQQQATPANWVAPTAVESASVYNPYNPIPQANPDLTSRQVEDPMLERLTAKVPVASFGFGGKLITVFPASGSGPTANPLQAGFTEPYGSSSGTFSKEEGTTVVIQRVSEVIPSNELQTFPGPLFMDGGTKSNLAKKRKEVVDWLEVKLDESEKELVFVQSQLRTTHGQDGKDPSDVDDLHDKIILLKLLKLLVQNEGKLSGTANVDEAVRLVLQPPSSQPGWEPNTIGPSSSSSSPINNVGGQDIIATYHTRASHLNTIQGLLSSGDRPKAVQTAIEQRNWTHALIIAHSLGNETWHETVKEFVRFELGDGDLSASALPDSPPLPSKGREGLRTLYTLFAGAGPAAVEEFSLSTANPSPQFEAHGMSTGASNGTLASPRVPSPAPIFHPSRSAGAKIPNNVLQQWHSVVAMTVANRVHGSTPFLLRLGDTLASNGKIYAAHITYLLSNAQMPQLCLDNGTRISLLGIPVLSSPDRPGLDLEAVMLTEVLEFALSLSTVPKNLDPFIGIPHLQAYRLALAFEYATFGMPDRANKYCEALAATLKLATKPCAFYHTPLFEQIKAFSGRLSSTPVADKGTSWITRKMPRPMLDNVWQTLEGRVHKFVAGDDDEDGYNSTASTLNGSTAQKKAQALGPFSHFSSISAVSASETVSRVQSSSDLAYDHTEAVSSLAGPFHPNAHLQRPSSGAGYSPSSYGQEPRRVSVSSSFNGSTLSPVDPAPFRSQTSSVPPLQHQQSYDQQSSLGRASPANSTSQAAESESTALIGSGGGGGWWEASSSYGTPVNSTPQPMFESIKDTPIADDGSGFIDPMASFGMPAFSPSPAAAHSPYHQEPAQMPSYDDHDDEDDLGFGNHSGRKRDSAAVGNQHDSPSSHHQPSSETQEQSTSNSNSNSIKPKPSGSWIGRWFKRDAAPVSQGPGPVKANLGEEFSLVYDPETKRWVNKKAGAAQPAPSGAPPPPPRAQTASPTSAMRPPPSSRPLSPMLNRTPSAGYPARASLDVPPSSAAPPPLPSNLSTPPPPPSTPGSSAAPKKPAGKKNIRSRYVEIR